jgi:hypothetical protein
MSKVLDLGRGKRRVRETLKGGVGRASMGRAGLKRSRGRRREMTVEDDQVPSNLW